MRKKIKQNILEMIQTMYEAHICVKHFSCNNNYEELPVVLGDCQQAAIEIGTVIEETESDAEKAIGCLEEYCETLYRVATDSDVDMDEAVSILDEKLLNAENFIKDIKEKIEVVFFPYKASMWDSLESIWKEADNDPECDVYVVPIPYYDRNPDRTFGEYHYEGDRYPDYVKVIPYEEYNIAEHRPDVVYIHNPYDHCNYVTSVDPRYYSSELKKYTDCLVYVPYFLLPNKQKEYSMLYTPVIFNADVIIAQSEHVKLAYEKELEGIPHKCNVLALGTPKTDKIIATFRNAPEIPKDWIEIAGDKRKIFLNTNVSLILNNKELFTENMRRAFEIFKRRGDVFVIWREHPLTYETLKSMKPGMIEEYEKLKKYFLENGIGVMDTNAEAYEAMQFSDCYYGAGGSLIPIYAATGKPMMTTAYNYPENILEQKVGVVSLLKQADRSMNFSERYSNFIDLFIDNYEILMEYRDKRMEFLNDLTILSDGSVGRNIMVCVKEIIN